MLHSISQQIWKTQKWPQDWKRPGFTSIPKKGNVKECSNYCTISLISHASKVTLKTLQVKRNLLSSIVYETRTSRCSKIDLEKAGEPDIKLPTSTEPQNERDNSRKNIYLSSMTMLKSLTVWITTNSGKFLKR